jgi:serpin B
MAELDRQFSTSVGQFSTDLYQKVIEGKNQNVIISPLSVQMAVSLAMFGASKQTEAEMKNALRFDAISRDNLAENFHQLVEEFNQVNGLQIANKLYVQDRYTVKDAFNEIAKNSFSSEAQNLDFGNNVQAAKTINDWVESKTNNKIKDLIKSDSLDQLTRVVLVNAIYFKGIWEHQFDKEKTFTGAFYLDEEKTVDVEYMTIKKHFRYGIFEDLQAAAVELPYKNSDISMLILLPFKKTGLPELENKLKTTSLDTISNQMYSTEVNVEIPKFKIEFDIELKDPLEKMGMARMFSDSAEFDNLLNTSESLKVSKVIHKAFIEINEEGAEAAAATGIQIMLFSAPIFHQEIFFKANHPFTFLIKRNSTVLFIGHKFN